MLLEKPTQAFGEVLSKTSKTHIYLFIKYSSNTYFVDVGIFLKMGRRSIKYIIL
jgi:hypothetical protein